MLLTNRSHVIISTLLSLVIVLALVLAIYVYRTTTQIRQALPQEVLEQQHSIFSILDDITHLLHAAELAKLSPSSAAISRVKLALEQASSRLQTLRRDYQFDFLFGAAATYAIVNPALADTQRWLQQGLYEFPPDSAIVSEIVYLRISDVYQQVRALFQESNSMAFQAVISERANLDRFRLSMAWGSGFFLLLLLGSLLLYWYLRQATAEANRMQQYLAQSIESLPEGIALFDGQHKLVTCNQHFRALFDLASLAPGQALTREKIFRHSIKAHRIQAVNDCTDSEGIAQLLLQTPKHHPLELALYDGRYIQFCEHLTQQNGLIGICADITHLKQTQTLLERMATHDALTDLATRRLFNDRLELALNRHRRQRQDIAIMFIDMDNFKSINDAYGHSIGDKVLQQAANHIQSCFRDTDTVARLGGDEFAVLLEGIGSRDRLAEFAERVLDSMQNLTAELQSTSLSIGASIGIALLQEGESSASLLRRADSACYQAKALGRSNYQFYNDQNDVFFSSSPQPASLKS